MALESLVPWPWAQNAWPGAHVHGVISPHAGHRGVWWPDGPFGKVNSLTMRPFVPGKALFLRFFVKPLIAQSAAPSTSYRESNSHVGPKGDRAGMGLEGIGAGELLWL